MMANRNTIMDNLLNGLYKYVEGIIDTVIEKDMSVAIWGYGVCGRWVRYLIEEIDGRKKVDYYIDENKQIYFDDMHCLYRSSLLEYLDSERTMVLICIKHFDQVKSVLNEYGYILGDNAKNIYCDIAESYSTYLELSIPELDFSICSGDNKEPEMMSHEPVLGGYSHRIFREISFLEKKVSLFDYGCGKGAALLLAHIVGIKEIGGVEYFANIYMICKSNMEKLGIKCDLYNDDAREFKGIDKYNVFFMFNPFAGEIMSRTIENLNESFSRMPRRIWIVYMNPICHKIVVAHGFYLRRQMLIDNSKCFVNFYCKDYGNEKTI